MSLACGEGKEHPSSGASGTTRILGLFKCTCEVAAGLRAAAGLGVAVFVALPLVCLAPGASAGMTFEDRGSSRIQHPLTQA